MKDQDLQRLFDYFDAPSHAFHSIRRREALSDVIGRWPVLGEANELVRELLDRSAVPTGGGPLQTLVKGHLVNVPEQLR